MSFTSEKRNQIKHYFLEKIKEEPNNAIKKTCETFNISQNTVYRYIRELKNNYIIFGDGQRISFVQSFDCVSINLNTNERIEEYDIFEKYIKKYIKPLSINIYKIWCHAFTEMMNNAIEHSQADTVQIGIWQNYLTTTILLNDDGIGIFKKIKEYYHYETLEDSINMLFKGKMTTDSSNHSGEGIFFTSRMLDKFALISDKKLFSHDKYFDISSDIDISKFKVHNKGTTVYMELSNFSKRTLREVFDMFSNKNEGFIKTRIPLKNIFDMYPVARSQARRLCEGFDKFKEIELDFDGIDDIGQGFAHELFIIYPKNHPNIKLIPLNVCDDVQTMINHVKNS